MSAFWRCAVLTAVATVTLCLRVAGFADPAAQAVITPGGFGGHQLASPSAAPLAGSPGTAGAPPRQLFVPDLIAAAPGGITAARLARIAKLGGVMAVLPPATFLELYQESAAWYCPGLSWTVLAAINEIESGDGANDGPSTAGALGPMQFLPLTWARWGIDGWGPLGPPDIMDALDAVPSAARLLCADGGGNPATVRSAIFDYNHATWYVNEVLALAGEYARDYP